MIFGGGTPANRPDFGLPSHYVGRLHDDVCLALLYAAADLFVAPSLQENLPYTIMEAMACGTPCVAFDVGGIPELIEHKQTGYLATPFDPDDLAAGMAWILDDEDRRRKLSRAGRAKIEREFELTQIARRHESLYREVLASAYSCRTSPGVNPIADEEQELQVSRA